MSKIARAARADCFTTVVHPPFKLSRSAPAVDHYLLTEAPLGRFILKAGMIRLFGQSQRLIVSATVPFTITKRDAL